MVQWFGVLTFTPGGTSSISGRETKILKACAAQREKGKKEKEKEKRRRENKSVEKEILISTSSHWKIKNLIFMKRKKKLSSKYR